MIIFLHLNFNIDLNSFNCNNTSILLLKFKKNNFKYYLVDITSYEYKKQYSG